VIGFDEPGPWLVLLVFAPLLAGTLIALAGARAIRVAVVAAALVQCAGLYSVTAALLAGEPVVHHMAGWAEPLGIRLVADGLSAVFLWMIWFVGVAVSIHALAYFAEASRRQRLSFPILWMMLWAALNATLLSADLFNLYVALELTTLSAVPLAALLGGRAALSAAMRYLLFALLGSLCYLLGVALLYGAHGTLDLYLLGTMLDVSVSAALAAGLITVGLMAKSAVFPLHAWLPAAHARAPGPVSALLSALVCKAGIYLLLRLWWWSFPELATPAVMALLGAIGAAAIVYGSVQAFIQIRLKRVIAYSTVAQLGYLLLIFPLASALAWQGVVYHGVAHGIAKAALFLAAANMMHVIGHDRLGSMRGLARGPLAPSLFAFALASLSIMGLPLSGGFIAKWLLLRAALAQDAWLWAGLLLVAGLMAGAYLFRVLAFLLRSAPNEVVQRPLPWSMSATPLLLAFAAVLMGVVAEPLLALIAADQPEMPGE
jgi:multicomponent Na+:H+ antiporter subunit D